MVLREARLSSGFFSGVVLVLTLGSVLLSSMWRTGNSKNVEACCRVSCMKPGPKEVSNIFDSSTNPFGKLQNPAYTLDTIRQDIAKIDKMSIPLSGNRHYMLRDRCLYNVVKGNSTMPIAIYTPPILDTCIQQLEKSTKELGSGIRTTHHGHGCLTGHTSLILVLAIDRKSVV